MEDITPQKEFDRTEPEVKVDTSPLGLSLSNTLEHSQARIAQRQLTELLSQWKNFGTVTMTAGMASGTHLKSFNFNQDFYAQHIGGTVGTQLPSSATTWFSGFRADVEIKIEQVSMMQQQGASIVALTSIPGPIYTLNNLTNIFNFNKLPRVYFKIGAETSVVFKIPWASNLEFWPIIPYDNEDALNALATNGYNNNGYLQHRVHAPLLVTEGVTDFVTYRYWVRLTNLQLRVYQPKQGLL